MLILIWLGFRILQYDYKNLDTHIYAHKAIVNVGEINCK